MLQETKWNKDWEGLIQSGNYGAPGDRSRDYEIGIEARSYRGKEKNGRSQVKTKKIETNWPSLEKDGNSSLRSHWKCLCAKEKEAIQGNGWETGETGGAGSPHPAGESFLGGQKEESYTQGRTEEDKNVGGHREVAGGKREASWDIGATAPLSLGGSKKAICWE